MFTEPIDRNQTPITCNGFQYMTIIVSFRKLWLRALIAATIYSKLTTLSPAAFNRLESYEPRDGRMLTMETGGCSQVPSTVPPLFELSSAIPASSTITCRHNEIANKVQPHPDLACMPASFDVQPDCAFYNMLLLPSSRTAGCSSNLSSFHGIRSTGS